MIFDQATATLAVTTLYAIDLHRTPDDAGLQGWVNALTSGAWTLAQEQVGFVTSVEYLAMQHLNVQGGPTDISDSGVNRMAAYTGGTPGYVNSAVRNTDTAGAGVTADEWTETNIINNYAVALAENVASYAQGNGYSSTTTWAQVDQATAHGSGAAVGLEVDSSSTSGSQAIGIDVVDQGGMTAAIRVPENVPFDVDSAHPGSYEIYLPGGDLEFMVNGHVAQVLT